MNAIRTLTLMLLTAIVVAFVVFNWGPPASVNLWPRANGETFNLQWPVGVIALFFFLLGFVPTWLYCRAERWRLTRRINSLENSMRVAASQTPIATATQLEAAKDEGNSS